MKPLTIIKERLSGLLTGIGRYPLTTAFLVAAFVVMIFHIRGNNEMLLLYYALLVGALVASCAQAAYECFFQHSGQRIILMGVALVLTVPYYLWLRTFDPMSARLSIVGAVILAALLLLYILIPALDRRVRFNDSFTQAFKAIFLAILFTAILFAGTALILTAFDRLLFPIDSNLYGYVANFIFTLFAPLLFLSQTPNPVQPGMQSNIGTHYEIASEPPRFWEILLSYIIIPLIGVFTIILLAYILLNLRRDFWSDNLMEPMLIAYSALGLLVFVLAGRVENRFADVYQMIFPKVLIPLVVFQLIASAMKIPEIGLTYGRYFVLLYGAFAVIAGILGSIFISRKNHWIAAILIVFMLVSVIPPVDAFSVSGRSQTQRLTTTLENNAILTGESKLQPNADVSEVDQKTITDAMDRLQQMGLLEKIPYLPDGYKHSEDFAKTFGFEPMYTQATEGDWVYVSRAPGGRLDLTGYQWMINSVRFDSHDPNATQGLGEYTIDDKTYRLEWRFDEKNQPLVLLDSTGKVLVSMEMTAIIEHLEKNGSGGKEVPVDQLFYTVDKDGATLGIFPIEGNVDLTGSTPQYSFSTDIFIKIEQAPAW